MALALAYPMEPTVGAVHPGVRMIARACDALDVTARHFLVTPEQARQLHSQIHGVIERLQALETLCLVTADALNEATHV